MKSQVGQFLVGCQYTQVGQNLREDIKLYCFSFETCLVCGLHISATFPDLDTDSLSLHQYIDTYLK